MEIATLASGCFWCVEAIFKRLKGVESVMPGYAGGTTKHPSYEEVCLGKTGHAEAIQIVFDPKIISYRKLLEVSFKLHDPTTLNQQGADIGIQYRSIIFYHNERQKQIAKEVIQELEKQKIYPRPIVTKIESFTHFYKAESYHQNYYDRNKDFPYCQVIIDPKIQKLYKQFKNDLKEEYKTP